MKLIGTPTGCIRVPSEFDESDLERMWHLVPDDDNDEDYIVHINADGLPLCGADLAGYRPSKYREGFRHCPACERVRMTGQMELLR